MAFKCKVKIAIEKDGEDFCTVKAKYGKMDYNNVHDLEKTVIGGLLAMGEAGRTLKPMKVGRGK